MFSLLIAGNLDAWEGDEIAFDISRFAIQTEEQFQQRFEARDLGRSVLRFARDLESIPALVGFEAYHKADFGLAYLEDIRQDGTEIRFHIRWADVAVPSHVVTDNMSFFEPFSGYALNQTHWAIKAGNLIEFLQKNGVGVPSAAPPPPKMPRSLALSATMMLQSLSHSDLNSFLIELDIPELDAPQSLGSRQDRANEIAKFVAEYPDALTLSGMRLDTSIVQRAMKADRNYPDGGLDGIDKALREKFWDGARRAGMIAAAPDPVKLFPLAPQKPFSASDITAEVKAKYAGAQNAPSNPASTSEIALEASATSIPSSKPRVFLVHGRDEVLKVEVENYLRKIGLDPIILHEQANGGRHLLTKFIEEAKSCQAAVVLMAAEDLGRHADDQDFEDRARQNVVLELGYFIGAFGLQKTFMLVKGRPVMPSDMNGVVHIPHTNWQRELAREMHEAGLPIDLSAAIRA